MAEIPDFKREFPFTSEVFKDEKEVYMLLGAPIGNDGKSPDYIIGYLFASEMYFWKSQGYTICVKINCPGGIIMDGFTIMDAIRETCAEIEIIGICASMAVSCALAAEKRSAYDYAKMLIHPPQGSDKKAVEMMRDSLATILKSRTSIPAKRIDEMLAEGAGDTWLDAEQMRKYKIIQEKIPTEIKLEGADTEDPYALYKVYNKLTIPEMANEPKPADSPTAAALQAQIETMNNLNAANASIAQKDAEIADLKKQIADIKTAQEAQRKADATLLVENAIKEKKIVVPEGNTTLKEQFITMALTTPEAFKSIVSTTKASTSVMSVTAHMQNNANASTEETYENLAINHPEKLREIAETDPQRFDMLVKNHNQPKTK